MKNTEKKAHVNHFIVKEVAFLYKAHKIHRKQVKNDKKFYKVCKKAYKKFAKLQIENEKLGQDIEILKKWGVENGLLKQ